MNTYLRRVEAPHILAAMREHAVDHYCAAPIVHNLLIAAPAAVCECGGTVAVVRVHGVPKAATPAIGARDVSREVSVAS